MAKGDTKIISDQNAVRRAAKQRQAAARKAAAEAKKRDQMNYRNGFNFVRDDRLAAVLEKQEWEAVTPEEVKVKIKAMKKAMMEGRKINEQIESWLDEADENNSVVLVDTEDFQKQAVRELRKWAEQYADRYVVLPTKSVGHWTLFRNIPCLIKEITCTPAKLNQLG